MIDLMSIAEAAATVQPFMGDLKAMNLPTDWRRRRPSLRRGLLRPVLSLTLRHIVKYPKTEIERAIREMVALGTAASPTK